LIMPRVSSLSIALRNRYFCSPFNVKCSNISFIEELVQPHC
jgi:hypothetical protein